MTNENDVKMTAVEIQEKEAERMRNIKANPQMAFVYTMADRIKWYTEVRVVIPAYEIEAYNEAVVRAQKWQKEHK